MSSAWSFALARLAGAIAAAIGLGLVFGRIGLWLTIVLGGMLTWQLVNLFRLQRWLRHRSQEAPPDLGGVWGDVITQVGRIYRRKQFHKRRVVQLFREFRRLSAALPDGVVLLSRGHEILWFNRAAETLLGLRRKADLGMPIENLIRQPEFSSYLHGHAGGAGVVVGMQGGERSMMLVVIPAGGQQLMLARDVTREARLEQMRKDFVANASHELRSPLTVIAGYLDQLGEANELGVEWREPIADMRLQAGRMREIVEDLLELSRMESSADEAPMLPVNVPELLERLVRETRASAATPPRFELDIKAEKGLLGSERELHSIASNLISNAVKYTPADGKITVRWTCDDAGAHLAIVDTGIGIAAEHLPRLTERFYRVDRARARASGGSGLGLSIVKHGLQRHGGHLEITSVEGHGSTFTAHFPSRRLLPATSVPGRARG
ncbi:MAG: Phosphate regulon sensor histidine kinase PhoR [Steroidobacteraceae bacterium]|nr:Phosphate regulon sensor histidine kinase PhoR [Steroidobacteraceae bacterium]